MVDIITPLTLALISSTVFYKWMERSGTGGGDEGINNPGHSALLSSTIYTTLSSSSSPCPPLNCAYHYCCGILQRATSRPFTSHSIILTNFNLSCCCCSSQTCTCSSLEGHSAENRIKKVNIFSFTFYVCVCVWQFTMTAQTPKLYAVCDTTQHGSGLNYS